MEYGSQKASSDVLKPRNIYIYIVTIYVFLIFRKICKTAELFELLLEILYRLISL
jgi:hypothetical protein